MDRKPRLVCRSLRDGDFGGVIDVVVPLLALELLGGGLVVTAGAGRGGRLGVTVSFASEAPVRTGCTIKAS